MWQCYGGSFDVFWPYSKGHIPATCTAGTGCRGCSQAHTSALCSAAELRGHALGPAQLSLEFPCSFSPWFLLFVCSDRRSLLCTRKHHEMTPLCPFLSVSLCFAFALLELQIAAGLRCSLSAASL